MYRGEARLDQDTSNQGIERDRLRLEDTKFRSESSHNRRALWVGAFVSIVAVIIPATSNYLNESARLKLEALRQEADLQHKTDDLRLKRSEMERSTDATRVKFLQDHIDMIMSDEPDADFKLTALANLHCRRTPMPLSLRFSQLEENSRRSARPLINSAKSLRRNKLPLKKVPPHL
ncbi:hypothetical protein OX88_27470 [Pseudomonas coronafaciens pv. porri]|nr:hypothetical protein OX88_27470 [Pseudomonas coronafaciens pv. porri]